MSIQISGRHFKRAERNDLEVRCLFDEMSITQNAPRSSPKNVRPGMRQKLRGNRSGLSLALSGRASFRNLVLYRGGEDDPREITRVREK